MNVTDTALKFKTTVYAIIAFIVIVGAVSYRSLPLEAAPEVKIPINFISTVYPGVSPEDMERLVTNVLEKELKDLKDVKSMTSKSMESVSMISIEFESGLDLDATYQKVKDRVDRAKAKLPADAEEPQIIELNFSEMPMMLVNISGEYDLDMLKKVAEGVQDNIEQIPGVLGVDLAGGLDREIQVYLNPDKMAHYKISALDVVQRIQQEHLTTPAGSMSLGRSRYSVRVPGEYKNVQLMEDIVLKAPSGNPVMLKDIGRVIDGFEERETISRTDGVESVTLRIKKRAGENIVSIADEVRNVLARTAPTFPETTQYTVRQDESEIIRSMVSDLENSIITGLILVLVVLLFAMGIRNAFFVAIAIPLSMLLSFVLIQAMGITLNMVVLFSLILALGMLVDNSIVIVENIYRHVTEGESRLTAARKATKEVAWPIVASTATTLVVFSPLLFWPGVMGSFMKYLPITVIAVLSSSLFVALVINPVIASDFLKMGKNSKFNDSEAAKGVIAAQYQRVLEWCLERPKQVLLIGILLLAGTLAAFGIFNAGVEFFPESSPDRAQVTIVAPQGTELEQTDAFAKSVEAIAQKEDDVESVVASVGVEADGFAGEGMSTHSAIVDIEFKDRHERAKNTFDTVASIREKLATLPGADYRIKLIENGPPTGDPVSVEVSGPDFGVLSDLAHQVKKLVATVPGVVDLKDNDEQGRPEIRITVDRQQAMLRKVNSLSVATAVRAAVNGLEASVLREGDEEYDIVVRYEENRRNSIEDILNIRITGEEGVQIPLRDVAKVETTGGLGVINHIDQNRSIAITSDVSGRSSTEVMADVQSLLGKSLDVPAGYTIVYSGENESQEESSAFLSKAFGIGLMLMFMILITQFNSVLRPGIILISVVMSLMGVFVGLLLTQGKFSIIMTGLGVISLAGVVVNNAIVLIDYTDQLKKKHGLALKAALIRAGVVRFRPVLLTAITTVLGLLPMALGISIDFRTLSIDTGAPTAEMWGPMAQAVCFGLVFATALTLVMVPVMYLTQEQGIQFLKQIKVRLAGLIGKPDLNTKPNEI